MSNVNGSRIFLPGKANDRGAMAKDNRLLLELVLWSGRTAVRRGVIWRNSAQAYDLHPFLEFAYVGCLASRIRVPEVLSDSRELDEAIDVVVYFAAMIICGCIVL